MRPPSLFEMLVTAITEQQISLAAAYRIRFRIIERFGFKVEELWAFPDAKTLAGASRKELRKCGLSKQKADYVISLAQKVADEDIDLNHMKYLSDAEVRSSIMQLKGIGRWSAEYFLVRGLGRSDALPSDDLGIKNLIGKYFGTSSSIKGPQVEEILKPLSPYRGLAAFYLLAHHRLTKTLLT
jgi:DNA-3-methyladenine glycosylase II